MKYIVIIAAALILIMLIIVIIGYALPVKHSASTQVSLNAAPEAVWQKLTDFKNYPDWRKDVKSVEIISDTSWIETSTDDDPLPIAIIEQEHLKKMVTKINSSNLPFGGVWTFTLHGDGLKTTVSITEDGEVYNPVFRFVSRFIMGHSASINKYAHDLDTYFNQK